MEDNSLQNILDSLKFNETYDIKGIDKHACTRIYKSLLTIRHAEFKLALEKKNKIIGGPVHLSAGQEAVPVGISEHLRRSDYIFGAHRSHGHILALGSSLRKLFAEVLGKENGLSKGFGGSMHLIDQSVGFMGSVPIVAGTISLAVGAALAISQRNSDDVSVAYLGDGAVEEGTFHESLNLSKVLNLPVIFVIENNLFSSHMDINLRQPSPFTSRFADANLIPKVVIDGNNILDVINSSKDLIQNARSKKGPMLIEAITYRWFGHVDWRDDIDVGINRCKKTLANWKNRCPIKRFEGSLLKSNVLEKEEILKIEEDVKKNVDESWTLAMEDSFPNKKNLLQNIYS